MRGAIIRLLLLGGPPAPQRDVAVRVEECRGRDDDGDVESEAQVLPTTAAALAALHVDAVLIAAPGASLKAGPVPPSSLPSSSSPAWRAWRRPADVQGRRRLSKRVQKSEFDESMCAVVGAQLID